MTSTAVVLGIARLGRPDAAPDCDCANDTSGSIAMRKGIVNFIGYPLDSVLVSFCFLKRVRPYSFRTKKLLLSEALYKKVPRLHQHLLTPLGGQGHPDRSQHPSHTGEQQLELRHFFFSRLTRNKRQ